MCRCCDVYVKCIIVSWKCLRVLEVNCNFTKFTQGAGFTKPSVFLWDVKMQKANYSWFYSKLKSALFNLFVIFTYRCCGFCTQSMH